MYLEKKIEGLEKKFYDLCNQVVAESGSALYDLEFNPSQALLRLYIHNAKGSFTATIDDCAKVDRALSEPLETLDWVPAKLTLEVSSPGVERKLYTKDHLESAIEKKVRIDLFKKLEMSTSRELPKSLIGKKKLIVLLKEVNEKELVVVAEKKATIRIGMNEISKAQIVFEF